jgi:hypothetical protein
VGRPRKDITGQKFRYLTALSFSHLVKHRIFWKFLCDCGKTRSLAASDVKSGKQISCGCRRFGPRTIQKRNGEDVARHSLFLNYRGVAKNRKLSWSLSEAEFCVLTRQSCSICGIAPFQIFEKKYAKHFYACKYVGLDRIDNTKGYEIENIRPCCKICNQAKHAYSEGEFQSWLDRIVAFRSSQEKNFYVPSLPN